jgi:chromosome segregation ATPase
VLRAREEDLQSYKKREYELNLKVKEQKDWEKDNQGLNQQLEAKARDIEEWKSRCSRLEEEATRGKEMVHYNNELTDKLDLASKELDRLNNLLRSKIDEIEKWKQRYSAKEAELTQYKNLENDVAQFESKLQMSKAENDRINGILKSRLEEIEAWKRKNGELEGAIARLGLLEKDKKMFEDKFNHQIKAIEELNFALNQLQNENDALRKYEQRCRDADSKNDGLAREMERLNHIIRGKEQEVNDGRIRLGKLEDAMNEYKNVEVYLKDLENKIALMTQENDRLNNLIKNKNDDLAQLEREKIELYSQVNKYKNYEPKMQENEQAIAQLKQALNKAQAQAGEAEQRIRAAENRHKDLENNLYSQSQEKEKVNSIARAKTQEAEELRNRYNEAQNELRKLPELQSICEQLHVQSSLPSAKVSSTSVTPKTSNAATKSWKTS